jgi:TonB family protein
MSVTVATLEPTRARTAGSMTASVGLHALLFVWILFLPHGPDERPAITEIAWIEEAEGPASAGGPAIGAPAAGPAAAPEPARQFRRLERQGELAPSPQSDVALDDRLNARLSALQGVSRAAVVTTPSPMGTDNGGPATLTNRSAGGGSAPLALRHGGSSGGPALELTRAGSGLSSPAAVVAGLPAPARAAPATTPAGGDATARRALSGASLMGPVADRAILTQVTPSYPEWAKREAVEASVTLHFIVRPDGSIKENVLVERTAGFEDFDENARSALRAWRFAPLRGGAAGEQWGTITFHFRLRDTG